MLTLSCDDGSASDVRVAALAKKYGISCVFYWPVEWHSLAYDNGYEPLSYQDAWKIAQEFEIGSHTITHRHLTKLSDEEAKLEVLESQAMLNNMFDIKVRKFCPPRGYTTENLTAYTLNYYSSQRLTKGAGLVHVHPDSGANGNVAWRKYYEMEKRRVGDVELWGHSHEWDRFDMWEEIEEFLKYETLHR